MSEVGLFSASDVLYRVTLLEEKMANGEARLAEGRLALRSHAKSIAELDENYSKLENRIMDHIGSHGHVCLAPCETRSLSEFGELRLRVVGKAPNFMAYALGHVAGMGLGTGHTQSKAIEQALQNLLEWEPET